MKTYRRLFVISLCLFLVVATTTVAYATIQTDGVSITGVRQAKSEWCWAASAQIAGKCVYPSSSRTQYSIVNHLKGATAGTSEEMYPNESGSLSDSVAGSEYMTYGNVDFRSTYSKWGYSEIVTSLVRGYPVQAAAGYYNWIIREGGHMVVIYMTQFIDNSDGSWMNLYYYDPWDGETHCCTYEAFCDASYNGRKYDQTVYVAQ